MAGVRGSKERQRPCGWLGALGWREVQRKTKADTESKEGQRWPATQQKLQERREAESLSQPTEEMNPANALVSAF